MALPGGACCSWGAQEPHSPHTPLAAKSSPIDAPCTAANTDGFFTQQELKKKKKTTHYSGVREQEPLEPLSCPPPAPPVGAAGKAVGAPKGGMLRSCSHRR